MTTPGRESEIVTTFIAFADRLVQDFDLLDLTIELTEDCIRLLDVAAAGLLLGDAAGRLHLLAATSEQARRLEVFQLRQQEGPCLECYRLGSTVEVPDLTEEAQRWPDFVASATAEGFVAVHAVPMRLRGEILGALGLFGTSRGSLSEPDLALAQALAHVASIAIAQQHKATHVGGTTSLPDLQAAVASRGILEMAKGVVAGGHGVDMVEAFSRLRLYSRASDQPLSQLSQRLVHGDAASRTRLLAAIANVWAEKPR